MQPFFKEFVETLVQLSKKKEIRLLILGVLLGVCLFACPVKTVLFVILTLGAVALYVLYRSLKREKEKED